MFRLFALLIALMPLAVMPFPAQGAEMPLIQAGAEWRYLDDGSSPGAQWRTAAFDDSAWSRGPAQLGYGDGDEQTVVSFGPNASEKFITTYFRRTFDVAGPGTFNALSLHTMRDDGAVVFLNGTEVWRSNMPNGPMAFDTLASAGVSGAGESTFFTAPVSPSLLVQGTNIVAVEVHQFAASSSDLSFDLQLTASTELPPASVTRGPYLQLGTASGIRIRWRTNIPTDSRVRYGTTAGTLDLVADDLSSTTEHEVTLSGLAAATRYYYSAGSTSATLAGNDAEHHFTTAPPAGSAKAARIWILGDSGTATSSAAAVRDAYLAFSAARPASLWLMLGDNAYPSGTDLDYQSAVFDMYPTMLRQSVLWPALGNHDTAQLETVPPALPYFAMFSLPTAGEAGGLPSGTEKYYSFDYGNIHFVCLDSMTSDRSTTGPMLTWLRDDLAATNQKWTIAFWHHPPYSKGSHDSDSEPALVQMRQNALPILEDYGVDLVLSGHSHSYERSFLIDSHYGTSSTFISSMKIDGGDGRPGGNGAYHKDTAGPASHEGAVYAVAGSSGQVQSATLDHPAHYASLAALGSMVLDVEQNRLDATFLRENGTAGDTFTILKGPSVTTGTDLYLLTPCRLLDTRGNTPLSAGVARRVVFGGACGIPAGARAVAVNVTAILPASTGFLTLYPSDIFRPATSTLNYRPQKTRANNAVLALSSDGALDVFNGGASALHFILDVTGYFQ